MTITENTTRPSENSITRRKMLQSVALTSTLAIVASMAASQSAVAMEETGPTPELLDLIDAHRAAWESFGDSCNAADSVHPDYAGAEGEAIWEMRNDAEQEALQLVLEFPVRTLADARAKASHLLCENYGLEPHDFKELLASLINGPQAIHIDTRTSAPPASEPLVETVEAYRAGLAEFDRNAPTGSDEVFDAYADKTFRPHFDALETWNTPAKTLPGAIAALRCAYLEERDCGNSNITLPLLAAAVGYFDYHA